MGWKVSEGAFDVGDALEEAVEEEDFRPVSLSQIDILRSVGKQAGLTGGELVVV